MNAGAYGGEIKDNLIYADVIDENGNVKRFRKAKLDLSYRHSAVMDKGYIVLDACFMFKKGDKEAVSKKVSELAAARKEKQPLEYPSAGSTFKRPEGHFAGKLIEDSGLKGYSIGGAAVSEKHCGFVINKGGASAEDVKKLVDYIQITVYNKFNILLEPEIRFVGD
jgi:UDP-N-acetylmuramate dehydrogenase